MEKNIKAVENIEGVSLRDTVYLSIRESILKGEFEPNKRLMEIPLSERMGVSRTPVREAIKRLEEEHLVIIVPKCGARVAPYTDKDVKDALDVRLTIENMAVRLAAKNINSEQIHKLRDINAEMQDAVNENDITKISEADNRLHNMICDAAGNRVLMNIMTMLEEQVLRYRVKYIKSVENYKILIREHEMLISALADRDEEKAAEIVSKHIRAQKDTICEMLDKKEN